MLSDSVNSETVSPKATTSGYPSRLTPRTLPSAVWTFLSPKASNRPSSRVGILYQIEAIFQPRETSYFEERYCLVKTWVVITMGTDIIIPITPANLKPIAKAKRVTIGLTPTDFSMIFGTMR